MADSFLPPVVANLFADISQFQAKMAEARGEMASTETQGSGAFAKLRAGGTASLLAVGAVAVGVGVAAIKMADAFDQSHARLVTAVHNSGSNINAWQSSVSAADKSAEQWGFTNAETENSLARLVPVTSSQAAATKDLTLAEDISAARKLSLEAATQLVVKVETGHVALLGRLGIATKDASGATISQAAALQKLSDMYGGSAASQAATFGGKLKILEAEVTDLGVKLGQFLIPILSKVADAVVSVAGTAETVLSPLGSMGDVLGVATQVGISFVPVLGQIYDATLNLGAATDTQQKAAQLAVTNQQRQLEGLPPLRAAVDAQTAATDKLSAAGYKLADADNAVWLAGLKLLGGWVGVDAAQQQAKDSSDKLQQAQVNAFTTAHDHTKTLYENYVAQQQLATAERDAVTAHIGLVASIEKLVKGYADAKDGGASARDSIEKLKAKFPELSGAINDIVARDLPALKTGLDQPHVVKVEAETAAANFKLDALHSRLVGVANTKAWAGVGVASIFGILAGSPGNAGINSWDKGGVIPGALGEPQLAIVHGQEEVLTPAQRASRGGAQGGGDTYHIYVTAGLGGDAEAVAVAIDNKLNALQRGGRRMAWHDQGLGRAAGQ